MSERHPQDSPTPGLPDSRTSGLPDSRTPGLPDSRTSGLPDSRTPGLPDFRTSGLPDFRTSQRRDSRTPEYPNSSTTITAFYRFAPVTDPTAWAQELREAAATAAIRGTILVASEGVNGTIAGPAEGVAAVLARIESRPGFADLPRRISQHDRPPFKKMLVKVKREIVTMGMPLLGDTGTYVAPQDWDAVVSRPGMVVVDTRNSFEFGEGHFTGAVDPATVSFREFPAWAEQHLSPEQPVAMYCTGGIRCEKATALLKAKGFREVYHLQGGILAYLEQTGNRSGAWTGTCFVFDERGTVDADLGAVPATCRQQPPG